MKTILLSPSYINSKKWSVLVDGKITHFGAKGYSDFTMHKDHERMERYITRHRSRENWGKSGIHSAGFWSRWLLWNKPSLTASIRDIEQRFHVKIVRQ